MLQWAGTRQQCGGIPRKIAMMAMETGSKKTEEMTAVAQKKGQGRAAKAKPPRGRNY